MAVSYSNAADNFKVQKSATKVCTEFMKMVRRILTTLNITSKSCLHVNEGGTYQNCYTETCNPACTDMLT